MDELPLAQTVAQAVQAATQAQQAQQHAGQHQQLQQQQQIISQQPSPAVQPIQTAQSSTIDNLVCQWQGCGERCDSAETLYDHVCERHVGRKSTNNLNLTCAWGACRTTTVKRDHITSHIRVHVPLKPHKCDFCGKAFKRPQDLKKHVKTHADDSVLMNSPQPGGNRVNGNNAALAQNASSYYPGPDGQMNPYPSYQPNMGANAPNAGYGQAANGQYAGYGSVSYPNNSMVDLSSMDTRRRAIEALNDFLGDIKRRAIDANSYYDVAQRLQSNALPLPVASGNGYNIGYNGQSGYANGFSAASLLESFSNNGMGGGNTQQGPLTQQGYSLPLPNARSKNDLQEIDRFLEQLQATVYETSNAAAAAGIQQPGSHAQYTGDFSNYGGANHQNQYRSSNSPPNMQNYHGGSAAAISSVGNVPGLTSSASSMDTPALTPASVSSYSSSGHSPMSSHGRSSLGGNAMYPSLPSVTGISDIGSGYPTTTSAPASGLASNFDGLDGRRYSGGRLQRQAPDQPREHTDSEMADALAAANAAHDEGSRTPTQSDMAARPKSKGDNTIDPALRGEAAKSPESIGTPMGGLSSGPASEGDDKRQEEWVENIRVIEALRKWIGERLRTGEFEDKPAGDDSQNVGQVTVDAKDDIMDTMVETAKMVEEKMADAEAEGGAQQQTQSPAEADVKIEYPSLPTA